MALKSFKYYIFTGLLSILPLAATYWILLKLFQFFSTPGATIVEFIFKDKVPGLFYLTNVKEEPKIAQKHKISLAQLSLAFVNQQPFVTSNIIGATTMKQLKEDIESISIELSSEIIDEINLVHKNNPNPAP